MNIPTTYIDKLGCIEGYTQLVNNYHNLSIFKGQFISTFILKIAEAEFISEALDQFQRFNGGSKERLIVDGYNRLLNCTLIFHLPITVSKNDIDQQTILDLEITIGTEEDPMNYKISSQRLTLENYSVQNKNGIVETGFNDLKNALPNNIKLKCCFNCAYSGFSLYSSGFFGCIICYRNAKIEFLNIKSKDDYVEISEKGVDKYMETHLCDEFEYRIAKTGYGMFQEEE